jgi:indolepyruvate ferredoxin oxidoreductase alpha subunit
MVEHAFALSEASNMPAVLTLRIRACHVRGTFECRDNVAPPVSTRHLLDDPAAFDYGKLAHPPVTFGQEKRKSAERIPRRGATSRGTDSTSASEVAAATSESSCRAASTTRSCGPRRSSASRMRSANARWQHWSSTSSIRWCPGRSRTSCRGKRAVLVVEEGQPEFIEQDIAATLRRAGVARRCAARTCCRTQASTPSR